MSTMLKIIIASFFALTLSACASTSSKVFNEKDLNKLNVGKSTKLDVNNLAGYPLFAETYTKEEAIVKLESLTRAKVPTNSLAAGKNTLWIYPTYLSSDDEPAHYDTLLVFDGEGVLALTETNK